MVCCFSSVWILDLRIHSNDWQGRDIHFLDDCCHEFLPCNLGKASSSVILAFIHSEGVLLNTWDWHSFRLALYFQSLYILSFFIGISKWPIVNLWPLCSFFTDTLILPVLNGPTEGLMLFYVGHIFTGIVGIFLLTDSCRQLVRSFYALFLGTVLLLGYYTDAFHLGMQEEFFEWECLILFGLYRSYVVDTKH